MIIELPGNHIRSALNTKMRENGFAIFVQFTSIQVLSCIEKASEENGI